MQAEQNHPCQLFLMPWHRPWQCSVQLSWKLKKCYRLMNVCKWLMYQFLKYLQTSTWQHILLFFFHNIPSTKAIIEVFIVIFLVNVFRWSLMSQSSQTLLLRSGWCVQLCIFNCVFLVEGYLCRWLSGVACMFSLYSFWSTLSTPISSHKPNS